MQQATVYMGCGCLRIWDFLYPAFVTEDSSKDKFSDNYKPFVNEENEEIYFVSENSDMSEAIKFSEVDEAPSLNDMASFVGIVDNGDDTFTNYRFTPAQLIAFVLPETRKTIELTEDSNVFTEDWIAGRDISSISTQGQSYNNYFFTQDGNDVTGINGLSFFSGQIITIYL